MPVLRRFAVLAACSTTLVLSAAAQTFAAGLTTTPPALSAARNSPGHVAAPAHPARMEEKRMYARVRNGVYTVDGMVAKVRLNYDVQGATYIYMFVPGMGTAVLSVMPDGKATIAPVPVHENELTFMVDGHHFHLSGVSLTNGKGQVPAHLYVRLDRAAWRLSRLPMMGYGNRAEMPFEWPGALPLQERADEEPMAPPIPASLLPRTAPMASLAQTAVAGTVALRGEAKGYAEAKSYADWD